MPAVRNFQGLEISGEQAGRLRYESSRGEPLPLVVISPMMKLSIAALSGKNCFQCLEDPLAPQGSRGAAVSREAV
jgi:hypothetical protein